MRYIEEEKAPQLFSAGNLLLAVLLHLLIFVFFWLMAIPFKSKEAVEPIELIFEAPPEEVAEEPKPIEKQPVKVEEPPKIEDVKVEAVEQIKEKPKPKEKPKKEPPKEKPKPEPQKEKPKPEPQKEKPKESKEERKKRMRDSAKVVKNPKPTPIAGTGVKLDKNWKELLNQGYKPGDRTQLAKSDLERCSALVKAAFIAKWERPAYTSSLKIAELQVRFGPGGTVLSYRLIKSSGDAKADQSVLSAASRVGVVHHLSSEFLDFQKKDGCTIRFEVKP